MIKQCKEIFRHYILALFSKNLHIKIKIQDYPTMPNFHVWLLDSFTVRLRVSANSAGAAALRSAEYVLQLSKIAEFITLGISESSFSTDIKCSFDRIKFNKVRNFVNLDENRSMECYMPVISL